MILKLVFTFRLLCCRVGALHYFILCTHWTYVGLPQVIKVFLVTDKVQTVLHYIYYTHKFSFVTSIVPPCQGTVSHFIKFHTFILCPLVTGRVRTVLHFLYCTHWSPVCLSHWVGYRRFIVLHIVDTGLLSACLR